MDKAQNFATDRPIIRLIIRSTKFTHHLTFTARFTCKLHQPVVDHTCHPSSEIVHTGEITKISTIDVLAKPGDRHPYVRQLRNRPR